MFQAFSQCYAYIFGLTEAFTRRRFWLLELAGLVFLYDLFVTFPSFDIYAEAFAPTWANKFYHAGHILEPLPFPPDSHESKLSFRLFLPVLINLFHLDVAGVLALKFLAGFLLLFVFARVAWQLTEDRVLAVWLTFAFGCINTPRCTLDISGMVDTFAFLFLLLPFLFRHSVVAFAGVFLAAWVDERGLIASSLVWLFFLFRGWRSSIGPLLGVVLAWVAYFGIRFYLASAYGLSISHEYIGFFNLLNQNTTVLLGTWGAFEGLWLLVLGGWFYLYKDRRFGELILFAGAVLVILLVAGMVSDISRSMSYAYPAILLSLSILARRESVKDLRKLVFLSMLFSWLYPAMIVGLSNTVVWQFPLPLQLLRMYVL